MAYSLGDASVPDGQLTQTIYGFIRDQKFGDAITALEQQLACLPSSRAALSLLAYAQYHAGQHEQAASTYERLTHLCPEQEEYRLYHAQSLYKAGMYPEAARAAVRVTSPELQCHVKALLVVNAYEQDDLAGCRQQLDQCTSAEAAAEVAVNTGCVLFKEGDYEGAAAKFREAAAAEAPQRPDLQYNLALCCYKLRQYSQALKHLAEVVEAGVRQHPELSVGSQQEGVEARSVGNSQVLRDSALVEAFNLKAAIELSLKNAAGAADALADMPPRAESELDPVSLHNAALVAAGTDPSSAFQRLNFLIASGSFPREAFANLLLLYCAPQHGFWDLAGDVMAEHPDYVANLLGKELRELLSCLVSRHRAPEAALDALDALAGRHVGRLRGLTKALQDARSSRSSEAIRVAIQQYDEALEHYIPVLMAMGSILWGRRAYGALEGLFKGSAEFCSEHAAWKLNLAHTFFMQESKFRDATRYYQPLVAAHASNLLALPAIVLANLCVAYIMTSQNEDAEELMRAVEREEEAAASAADAAAAAGPRGGGSAGGPGSSAPPQLLHLAIINLVIGTLYCSKGNFEFGVSRVIRSLEPYAEKLSADTWHYSKRVLLALTEGLAKHMVAFKAESWEELLAFLADVEVAGRGVAVSHAAAASQLQGGGGGGGGGGRVPAGLLAGPTTVAAEARLLRGVLLQIRDMY